MIYYMKGYIKDVYDKKVDAITGGFLSHHICRRADQSSIAMDRPCIDERARGRERDP